MLRYADPTRCPDCSSTLIALSPPSPSCPACGLPLTGPLVDELFATLQTVDRLVAQLRATAVAPRPLPSYDAPVVGVAPRVRLGAPSVPRILLSLGVLCLLVAAVAFLAVAWSWLGVGGRTAVLLLLTATSGGLSGWLGRRELRWASESLAVVGLGLLTLDVVGADNAGWLGSLTGGQLVTATGMTVGVVGLGAAGLQRSEPARLVTPQVLGALGLWTAAAGVAAETAHLAPVAALATVGLLALAGAVRSLSLGLLAALLGVAGGTWWLLLVAIGADRASEHRSVAELVGRGDAWPSLVAIALLAVAAFLVRRHPAPASAALGTAGTLGALLVMVPASDNGWAQLTLVVLTLLVAGALATPAVAPLWRWSIEVPVVVLGLAAVALGWVPVVAALGIVTPSDGSVWAQPWTGSPAVLDYLDGRAPMIVLVPLAAAVMTAALTWRRPLPLVLGTARDLAVPMVAGLLVAGAVVALDTARPWVVASALLVAAAGSLGWWAEPRTDRLGATGLIGAVLSTLGAFLVALPSVGLTAVTLALVVAASGWLQERTRPAGHDREVRLAGGVLLPAALAGLGWSVAELGGLDDVWRAGPVLVALGALAVARPRLPVELSAAVSATTIATASVIAADHWPAALAAYLTLAGALVTVAALAHDHRRHLGWLGAALLAAATWVRLADLGIEVPEAYTLPSAVALLVVGLRHLSRQPDAGTGRALAPGLLLATVPSLLRVLVEDPVSLRAALLGAACLGLVLAGAQLRWQAPLLVGAAVGAVLVLREWAPYAAVVPPWMLIAAAGTALVVVGVTWEARLRDVRGGASYVARLR